MKESSSDKNQGEMPGKQPNFGECPVCMNFYTRKSEVYQCGRGHFICGLCKPNLPVSYTMCKCLINLIFTLSRNRFAQPVEKNSLEEQ